tara:strand:- start:949 stop:1467 length:519 start_codon:yes stop_codon:yes gene_type:complete
MEEILMQLLVSVGPAIVVGVVAYYFFNRFMENEDGRRRFLLHKDAQADTLPLRLQAYERLTLFLERIQPAQLLLRVKPTGDKNNYEQLLVAQIEQEFEHNLSQQIYMSSECWNVIKSAKNSTIKLIRQTNMSESINSPDKLRETILRDLIDKQAPSSIALEYLNREVKEILG